MAKTMRFGDLVRVSGRPEAVTLWTDPKKDRAFSKAVRENRVLTINEDPRRTKKEYGQIGFHRSDNATYFVFPRLTTCRSLSSAFELITTEKNVAQTIKASCFIRFEGYTVGPARQKGYANSSAKMHYLKMHYLLLRGGTFDVFGSKCCPGGMLTRPKSQRVSPEVPRKRNPTLPR
jgi:hypothetical protein